MRRIKGQFIMMFLASFLILTTGCFFSFPTGQRGTTSLPTEAVNLALPQTTENEKLLIESWQAYRQRFIQDDGRVIDWEADSRTVSEGQAYAMLRAVLINDHVTFAKTLAWGENNLQRRVKGKISDRLWAWKWGRNEAGNWGIIDANFASDADIDAITALIFAARRWNRPDYLQLAIDKLQDLWKFSTFETSYKARILLPGPKEAFLISPSTIILNPSYLAPYAFRLFAQVDSAHNWLSLIDTSYQILNNSAQLSAVKLPSDWVSLDTQSGQYQVLPESSSLKTIYGFDAYRVWWRLLWDAAWFNAPQAVQFLSQHLVYLQELWRKEQKIPAQINLQGEPVVNYEATSQYAMLYPAFEQIDLAVAQAIFKSKLLPAYRQGIWDNNNAYYTQNLAWLGILPTNAVTEQLLKP
jgi:endoglucanase